ncbi:MAG: acyltransferase family protein [Smithella sp.]
MENTQNRFVYLDNIRNFLVYNVVLLHVISMFAYPLSFWWAVIDKEGSSRFYETSLIPMGIYLMPCLLFIAALFIFPSLKKSTSLEYVKNRFMRLCVPVIVFLFCAGDVFNQLRLKRLNPVSPDYSETFLNFWGAFVNMPGIYLTSSQKTLNTVDFSFSHIWFLTLLFFITLVVVLLSLPFKRKNSEPKKLNSRKKNILQTIIFAVVLSIVYAAAMINYVSHHIDFGSWIIIGKGIQFNLDKIWILIPMFLFGLYAYKKEWLTRGDTGNWKMWGVLAFIPLALYVLLYHIGILPTLDEILKVVEHNMQFDNKIAVPVADGSVQLSFLCSWILLPPACVFLLMFSLSFTKKFFNKPNLITSFCSKHSINVYILHYIPVIILQSVFVNVPITPILKILLMTVIVIPACLWLSHRLVYPYPKAAIAFFVALKLAALAAGFTFYYYALLSLIFISFAGALYESARVMVARKAGLKSA